MSRIFIDTNAQAAKQAVQAFADSNRIPRNANVAEEVSNKLVALCKGMDLTEQQFRHLATLVLNDEKRINAAKANEGKLTQAGRPSLAEHKQELAMQAVADLKAKMRVNSTTRVLQFVAALNAYLKELHHGDIHRVLAENDKRGGGLGSEPFIVRHLAGHFNKHLAAQDKASKAAKWPAMKAAHVVSASITPGGILSGHIPDNSVMSRLRATQQAAALHAAGVSTEAAK